MTRETIYGFIAAEKTTYPVRLLCRVLQVSQSAFYAWIRRGSPVVADDDLDDAHAANELRDAWAAHRHTYGARRLTAEICERGQRWNRKKVRHITGDKAARVVVAEQGFAAAQVAVVASVADVATGSVFGISRRRPRSSRRCCGPSASVSLR